MSIDIFQGRCCSFFKTDCKHDAPVGCELPKTPSRGSRLPRLQQLTIAQTLSKTRDKIERPSLLSLPPGVRRQIYWHSGIPYRAEMVLQLGFCFPYRAICSLPLVCRLVYDEVTQLLFAENHFVVYHAKPGDLQCLRSFSPRVYQSLQSLELHIQFTACTHAGGCHHRNDQTQATLDCQSRRNLAMYQEWTCTAQILARHVTARRLEMRFQCAVKSLGAASACLEPFSSKDMPELAECLIDLRSPEIDETSNAEIAAFARTVSLQRTAWKPNRQRFPRFLELPAELQLRVLEYTDLVAPFREVDFHVDVKGVSRYSIYSGVSYCDTVPKRLGIEERDCDPQLHHACQYYPLWNHCRTFCRRKGINDPRCTCWVPPTALFLVSKRTRRLSQEIFFSRNRFVFSPAHIEDVHNFAHDGSMSAMTAFLRQGHHQQWLQWLTKLELALPALWRYHKNLSDATSVEDWASSIGAAHTQLMASLRDWASSIEAARTELVDSSLEITVFISSHGVSHLPSRMTPEQSNFNRSQYKNILFPLSRLESMKRFFVITVVPYPWSQWCTDCDKREVDPNASEALEQGLERLVMGDDYTCDRAKKWPRQLPLHILHWQRWHTSRDPSICDCSSPI